jgi:hypothetical protein
LGRLFRVDDDSHGNFYGYQILYEPGKRVLIISKFSPSLEPIKDIFRLEDKQIENEVKPYAPNLLFRIMSNDGLLVANNSEYKFDMAERRSGENSSHRLSSVTFTATDKERYLKSCPQKAALHQDGLCVPR